jgi:hypothetical protein
MGSPVAFLDPAPLPARIEVDKVVLVVCCHDEIGGGEGQPEAFGHLQQRRLDAMRELHGLVA